jgi:cysteine desulfurase
MAGFNRPPLASCGKSAGASTRRCGIKLISRAFVISHAAASLYNVRMPADLLDHNSTTPIDPRVVEAMARAWHDCGANPASQHAPGRKARRMLEEAREGIAELLGAKTGGMDADQVIFTSGGTEANNLALFGLAGEHGARVIVSMTEHPSIHVTADELDDNLRYDVHAYRVQFNGLVRFDHLTGLLAPHTSLVSLMLANNETGVIQPLAKIASLCHSQNILFHTDAVQAVGKIPVSFAELGVDAMTVTPHKFHGPLGIGALVLRRGVRIKPRLFGGFQQGALRPGTESVALAVGFHEALKLAIGELPERAERMRFLRDEMERSLREVFPTDSEFVIIGEAAARLPNTSNVSFPRLDRQAP